MLGILLFLVIAYILSNFVYITPLRAEYKEKGFWGAVNFSLGLFIHQIAKVIVVILGVFGLDD